MMPKAYSYLRFSTPDQIRGDSFRRQLVAAEDYALRHGLELDASLTFRDLGVSAYRGRNATHGALRAFFDAVDQGIIESGSYLLVESLDRISRDEVLKAQGQFINIISAGITLVTLIDQRSYSYASVNANPTDLIVSLLTMMRAREESEVKSQRLKAAWSNKRANAGSKALTAKGPGWLRLVDRKWEVIPDRAAIVRRIVDMTLSGQGQQTIAATLNSEGVTPFAGGKMFHRSTIKKIIESSALAGVYIPSVMDHVDGKRLRVPQEPVAGYYPRIVTDEEAAQLQSLVSKRQPQHRATGIQSIVAGLATCAHCGSSMTRVNKGKGNGKPKLICTSAKMGKGCTYRTVDLMEVEMTVRGALFSLSQSYPSGDPDLDELARKAEELDAALSVVVGELIEQGRSPRLTAVRTELETKLREVESQLRERATASQRRTLMDPEKLIELQDAPVATLNQALRQLFKRIVVTTDGLLSVQFEPI